MKQQFNNSQLLLIARIIKYAMKHYENGGSWVIETMTHQEMIDTFPTVRAAKEWIRAIHSHQQDIYNA